MIKKENADNTRYGTVTRKKDKVPISLFWDGEAYKDDLFVAVNGKGIQIQRGKSVDVKPEYAAVIKQQMRQDRIASEMQRAAADEFANNPNTVN